MKQRVGEEGGSQVKVRRGDACVGGKRAQSWRGGGAGAPALAGNSGLQSVSL